MRNHPILSLTVIAAAIAGIAGCAQLGLVPVDARYVDVAPVYRGGDVPGTAAGQVALGRIDLAVGRIDAAVARFTNAIALDPTHAEAYNSLGVAQGLLGRFDEAVATFREGLRHDPDSARLFNNLGYAQLRSGQTEAAALSLSRALELDATSERTQGNLRLLAEARTPAGADKGALAASDVQGPAPVAAATAAAQTIAEPAPTRPAPYTVIAQSTPTASLRQIVPGVYEYRSTDSGSEGGRIGVASARALAEDRAALPVAVQQPASGAAMNPAPAVVARLSPVAIASPAPAAAPSPAPVAAATQAPVARLVTSAPPRSIEPAKASAVESVSPSGSTSPSASTGVEVSNGVGIPGVAGLAAHQLSRVGVGVVRVSNNRSWTLRQTQVSYRAGHEEAARALARTLPFEVRLVEVAELASGVNLRLIIGQNIATAPGVNFLRGKFAANARSSAAVISSTQSQPSALRTASGESGFDLQS